MLGGSYNPVHCGHVAIAQSFVACPFINQLWVLLTPTPPHKKNRSFADYHDRLEMLEIAFKSIDDIVVSDIEQHIDPPQYTFKTVRYLTNQYPDVTFYICLGEDGYLSFDTWYSYDKILSHCDLLVARRPGFKTEQQEHTMIRRKSHFIDHRPIKISSTQIREKLQKGDDLSGLVPQKVENYIRKKELYRH